MTQYVLSSIESTGRKPIPTTLSVHTHEAVAVMCMHQEARTHLKTLVEKKIQHELPKNVRLMLALRKVPIIKFAQLTDEDHTTTLSGDVRVGGEYAMLYMNEKETWLDVVHLKEQAPHWWSTNKSGVVEFESLISFTVQPIVQTKPDPRILQNYKIPSGSNPQAYKTWRAKRDRVMRDLNKKLAEKAYTLQNTLERSALKFEWD